MALLDLKEKLDERQPGEIILIQADETKFFMVDLQTFLSMLTDPQVLASVRRSTEAVLRQKTIVHLSLDEQ